MALADSTTETLHREAPVAREGQADQLAEVVRRAVRDLDVASALITLDLGHRRQLLAANGGDAIPLLWVVGASRPTPGVTCGHELPQRNGVAPTSPGAHVYAPIVLADPGAAAGLWVVSRGRRWFGPDEVRHLYLLAARAAPMVRPAAMIDLDRRVDVQPGEALVVS